MAKNTNANIPTGLDDVVQSREIVRRLDAGEARAAHKTRGKWVANEQVKRAILTFLKSSKIREFKENDFSYFDKAGLKKIRIEDGVRIVPLGTAIRYGAFVEKGVVIMPPSYVNIGARVGANTMIDSHVLVGSCAQVGSNVHISCGTMIGGVLEPARARPVIVEDNAFVGGGCGLYDGAVVGEGAVIGSGVVINSSTPIIDAVRGAEYRLEVPPRSVVVRGVNQKTVNGRETLLDCAVIVKMRDENTSAKIALEQALR